MIEACLKRKIVSEFLNEYKQKKWNSIIPSLLEIAILHLYNSFKKSFFSADELLEIIESMKSKMISNMMNPNDKAQLKIDYNLNKNDSILNKRNSHRSFSKNTKNINELNFGTYDNFDNKLINFYNKTKRVSPINKLIKNIDSEDNLLSNKFKKFWKLNKSINNKKENINEINNKNIMHTQSINFNTIELNNTYRSNKTYLSYNNSILLDNSNEIEYIKVNKAENMKRLKDDQINIQNSNINQTYSKDMNNDIFFQMNKINKTARIQKINSFKQEDLLLTDYNQRKTKRDLENKYLYTNNFFLNKQKYSSSNKSDFSYNKNNNDLNSLLKSKKLKNLYNKFNLKKITNKDIRTKQFSNIQKTNIKNDKDEYNKNDDINNDNLENINDNYINNSIRNTTNTSTNIRKFKLMDQNERNNIINYNSFKTQKSLKNKTSLNDPNFCVKAKNNKRKFIKKF